MTRVLEMKYVRVWRGIGALMIAGAFVVSLMPSPVRTGFNHADKLFHAITYASMMYWFVQIYSRDRHVLIAVALVMMGICIEGLQYLTGYRMAEFMDAVANAIGVGIGWGLYLTPLGGAVCCWTKSSGGL